MASLESMLKDVGITEQGDLETAMAYCGVVSEEYSDLAKHMPHRADDISIGAINYFIVTYEQSFSEFRDNSTEGDEQRFSDYLQQQGIVAIEDVSVAKSFLRDFTQILLSNADAMIGQQPLAVPIVLVAARKLLALLKEQKANDD